MVLEVMVGLAPFVDALGWTLLHSLWQVSLIALGYALLARLLAPGSPQHRLALGYAALALMVVWPAATLLGLLRGESITAGAQGGVSQAPLAVVGGDSGLAAQADLALSILVLLWGLGVLGLSLRAAWRWRALTRLCQRATPLAPSWLKLLGDWQQRLGVGVRVKLLESTEVVVPIVIGWLRPLILLPAGMCLRLCAGQLELIIAHELAHVRRWDAVANALQLVVETLLFHHPLVHWVSRQVRDDRELCCDDLVAAHGGDRLNYARALLAAAEAQRAAVPSRLVLAATGGVLLRRIERIVGSEQPEPSIVNRLESPRLLPALIAGLLLLLALRLAPNDTATLPALRASAIDVARIAFPTGSLLVSDLSLADVPRRLSTLVGAAEREIGLDLAERLPPPPLPSLAAKDLPLRLEFTAPSPPLTAPSDAGASAVDLQPVERVLPSYPRSAYLRGIEGEVELSFSVDRSGRIRDIRIEQARPAGVFESAATTALQRWRFGEGQASGNRQYQVFAFTLPDDRERRGSCEAPTGTRICRNAF